MSLPTQLIVVGVIAVTLSVWALIVRVAGMRQRRRLLDLYADDLALYNAGAFNEIVEPDRRDSRHLLVTRLGFEIESSGGTRAIAMNAGRQSSGTAIHQTNRNGTFSKKGPYFISKRAKNWRLTGRTHLIQVCRLTGGLAFEPDHYNQTGATILEKGIAILEYDTSKYRPITIYEYAARFPARQPGGTETKVDAEKRNTLRGAIVAIPLFMLAAAMGPLLVMWATGMGVFSLKREDTPAKTLKGERLDTPVPMEPRLRRLLSLLARARVALTNANNGDSRRHESGELYSSPDRARFEFAAFSFLVPNDWTCLREDDEFALVTPERTHSIVGTVYDDADAEQSLRDLDLLLHRQWRSVRTTHPTRTQALNGSPSAVISGTGEFEGTAVCWSAYIVRGSQSVFFLSIARDDGSRVQINRLNHFVASIRRR